MIETIDRALLHSSPKGGVSLQFWKMFYIFFPHLQPAQLLPVYPTLHLLQFELHFGAILLSLRAGNRPRRRAQFSQDYSGEVCNYPLFATIFLCKYLFHFSKKMRTNKMKLQKQFKRCFNCCFQNNALTNSFSNIDLGF